MVDYTQVPNPAANNAAEADIGERNSFMSANSSSEPIHDGGLLGGNLAAPAPSIMSRDSTYGSLNTPSISGDGARSSWGSGQLLGASGNAALPAGADVSLLSPHCISFISRPCGKTVSKNLQAPAPPQPLSPLFFGSCRLQRRFHQAINALALPGVECICDVLGNEDGRGKRLWG